MNGFNMYNIINMNNTINMNNIGHRRHRGWFTR